MTIAGRRPWPHRRGPGNRWTERLRPDQDGRWPERAHATAWCLADGVWQLRVGKQGADCSGIPHGQWAQWCVARCWEAQPPLVVVVVVLKAWRRPAVHPQLLSRQLTAWPVAWQAADGGPRACVSLRRPRVWEAPPASEAAMAALVQPEALLRRVLTAWAVLAQRPSAWRSASAG
ncbi:hypothetical protein SAMN05444064_111112 [Pseudomonas syringae]|nr:hypothetical protein SAMN05444514_12334 [Pseudomonas syringae]SFM21761.1 hypothetical protein SAMN05444064_111112 [Pseudomonas syringae]